MGLDAMKERVEVGGRVPGNAYLETSLKGKVPLAHDNIQINTKDKLYCRTPLSWAAREGHSEGVKLLITHDDIQLNLQDETVLLWIVLNSHLKVAKLLLHKFPLLHLKMELL